MSLRETTPLPRAQEPTDVYLVQTHDSHLDLPENGRGQSTFMNVYTGTYHYGVFGVFRGGRGCAKRCREPRK